MTHLSALRSRLGAPATALLSVAFVAAMAAPASAQTPTSEAPSTGSAEEPEPPVVRMITFPVVGPVTYTDTWGACRGTGCSRAHKGADLFGSKLAPLVAAVDGTVVSLRRSSTTSAGNSIVIRDADGWLYLYLHLNNDSPGTDDRANPEAWIIPNALRVGDRVVAGEVIGYLGDSGNAESTPAHLHFELHEPGVGAINPTASVDAAREAGRVVPVSDVASSAAGRAEHEPLISAWYRALLKREPTSEEMFAWADRFAVGLADRNTLIADLTMAPQRRGPSGAVIRSYYVTLGRRPSLEELRAGESRFRDGGVDSVAASLLGSSAFTDRHGSLSDARFVEVIYTSARGTAPSDTVRDYWITQLADGRPRAEMVGYFAESYAMKDAIWHELEVMQAFRAALDRGPSDAEFNRYLAHLDGGGLIVDVVDAIKG